MHPAIENIWHHYPAGVPIQTACSDGVDTNSTIEYLWPFYPDPLPADYTNRIGMNTAAEDIEPYCSTHDPLAESYSTGMDLIMGDTYHNYPNRLLSQNRASEISQEEYYDRQPLTLMSDSSLGNCIPGLSTHPTTNHLQNIRTSPGRITDNLSVYAAA